MSSNDATVESSGASGSTSPAKDIDDAEAFVSSVRKLDFDISFMSLKVLNLLSSFYGFFPGHIDFAAVLKLATQPYLDNIPAYENEALNLNVKHGAYMVSSGRYIDLAAVIIGKRKISQAVMHFVIIHLFLIYWFL